MGSTLARSVVAIGVLGAAIVGTAALIAGPTTANATAPSRVVSFEAAALPQALRSLATKVADEAAIDTGALVDAAPVGTQTNAAGVFVGTDAVGVEMAAVHSAHGMTGFMPLSETAPRYGGLMVWDQNSGTSVETLHVSVEGIVDQRVATVILDLARGGAVEVDLVSAGHSGYTFFTYVSSDPATFPTAAHAYGRDGSKLKTQDLRDDFRPPCPASSPNCLAGAGDGGGG